MKPRLLKNVASGDYHSGALPDPETGENPIRLSRSIAVKLIQETPLRAYDTHPRLGGAARAAGLEDEEEPEKVKRLEMGSLLHTLLLGAGARVAVVEADSWRTNAAKDAREEARGNGLLPVLAGKYHAALATAGEIRKSLQRYGVVLAEYEPEVTCLWTTRQGVDAKCRMDALTLARGVVLDVKIQPRISLGSFKRGILGYGLHIQNAAYCEGLATVYPEIAGRESLAFLICEYLPPYDVAIQPLAPNFVELGRLQWARAQKIWLRCMESGQWPGYGLQPPIEATPYQLEEEFSVALDAAGEPDWAKGA